MIDIMGNIPSKSMGDYLRAGVRTIGHNPIMKADWKSRVTARLNEMGLDMKAASRKAGKGETFVRDMLERGRSPSIDNFLALAEALEVSAAYLIGGTPPELTADEANLIEGYRGLTDDQKDAFLKLTGSMRPGSSQ